MISVTRATLRASSARQLRRSLGVLLALRTAVLRPPDVASAQPLTACPTCRAERTLIGVLGSDTDKDFPAEQGAFPLRFSDGHTVVRGSEQAQLLLFDARGKFVRSTARRGGGPGELHRIITAEISAGDTLFAHQPGGIAAFSRNGAFLRQVPVDNAGIFSMLPLPSGRFVVSMPMASNGITLGSLSANGRVLSGFDAAKDESSCLPCKTRRLARSNRATQFFAVSWSNYAIETWTDDGTLVRRVQMNRDWFPPNADRGRSVRGQRVRRLR